MERTMVERVLDGEENLVFIGFRCDHEERALLIPVDDFHLSAKQLRDSYKSKIVVRNIGTDKMFSVNVPIVIKNSKPFAKWIVRSNVTQESGLICFQYRAVNDFYRLLAGKKYKGIIFDIV